MNLRQVDTFGTRGQNVRVHTNGIPVERRSKRSLYITMAIMLVLVNVMFVLFLSIGGGCFQIMDMSLSSEYLTVYEGDAHSLSAVVRSKGEGNLSFTWESSDPEIVSVNADGGVTALKSGKATITATEIASDMTAQCTVTVLALSKMQLNAQSCQLGVGETASLTATANDGDIVYFASEDPNIATVTGDGTITAASTGSVNIVAYCDGYADEICEVTVKNAPSVISFTTSLSICAGESRELKAKAAKNETCADFTFTCPEGGVIELSEDGKTMIAKTAGTGSITATAYNGVTVTAPVTVKEAPSKVFINMESAMYTGQSIKVTPGDNTGACGQFTYSSSDDSVISVDKNGIATAHKKGSAKITCTSFNGVSAGKTAAVSIVDYKTPYTSERVSRNIEDFCNSYPDLITSESIGKSTCGTDIMLVKFGKGAKKAIICGGIHSREDITVNFVMRCIEDYADTYYSATGKYGSFNLKKLLDEWTLYIVPAMNPDGLDIANAGMKPLWTDEELTEKEMFDYKNTATGVNLNRNFPFYWGVEDPTINKTTPDIDSYIGKEEASEPETKAIIKLCAENSFEWLYNMHIKGNMIFWADTINPNAEKAEYLANRLVVNCKYNLMRTSTVAGASGGMENWFRAEYKKPGFCIELMEDTWSSEVNKYFDKKLNWAKTRYTFIYGMVYG